MAVLLPLRSLADTTSKFLRFTTTLDGSRDFTFEFKFNTNNSSWYMDIYTATGAPVCTGVRVVLLYPLTGHVVSEDAPRDVFVAVANDNDVSEPGLGDLGGRVDIWYGLPNG